MSEPTFMDRYLALPGNRELSEHLRAYEADRQLGAALRAALGAERLFADPGAERPPSQMGPLMAKDIDQITVGVGDLRRVGSPFTIKVRLSRPLRFRIWLAMKFLGVAAWLGAGSTQAEIVG